MCAFRACGALVVHTGAVCCVVVGVDFAFGTTKVALRHWGDVVCTLVGLWYY